MNDRTNPILHSRILAAFTLLLGTLTLIPTAQARDWEDWARVTHVEPIITTHLVNHPREECWTRPVRERVLHRRQGDALPAIVGGSLGGFLGHHLGEGRNRRAATIAGAALGAGLGHGLSVQRRTEVRYRTEHVRQCELVDDYREVEEIDGYRVSYRYRGRDFTRRMDYHPGARIRVNVRVRPLAPGAGYGPRNTRADNDAVYEITSNRSGNGWRNG